MHEEREKDSDSEEMVLCIGLENVDALPSASVSCFFSIKGS